MFGYTNSRSQYLVHVLSFSLQAEMNGLQHFSCIEDIKSLNGQNNTDNMVQNNIANVSDKKYVLISFRNAFEKKTKVLGFYFSLYQTVEKRVTFYWYVRRYVFFY